MKTVWKYNIETTDDQILKMPEGSTFLKVAIHHGSPTIWMLVDTEAEYAPYHISIYGTGHPIKEGWDAKDYRGTIFQHYGHIVFHIFMREVKYGGVQHTSIHIDELKHWEEANEHSN